MLYHAVDSFSKALPFVYLLHVTGSITCFLTRSRCLHLVRSMALYVWTGAYGRSGAGQRRRTDLHRPSQINEANPTSDQMKERSKVGIVNFSHYHLSFFNYFYLFKMRLRFDFVLNAAKNLIRHTLICFLIKSG